MQRRDMHNIRANAFSNGMTQFLEKSIKSGNNAPRRRLSAKSKLDFFYKKQQQHGISDLNTFAISFFLNYMKTQVNINLYVLSACTV